MNFLTLKQRTLRKLNESSSSPQNWSLTEIGDFLNEGYVDLVSGIKLLEASTTLSTVANQYVYSLNSSALDITRMYYETADFLIEPITWRELNKIDQWFNERTDMYPTRRMSNIGTQKVFLWPKVVTSETDCITYWYHYIPTDMSAEGDTPAGPKTFHDALMDFAAAIALMRHRAPEAKIRGRKFFEDYLMKKQVLENLTINQVNKIKQVRVWE